MVVMAVASSSERSSASGYLNAGRQSEEAISKLKQLRLLKEVALNRDASRLGELLRLIAHLQSDNCSPVRKFIAQVIGEVGSKYTEVLPELMPSLLIFLADGTPAVTRQAVTTGTQLFHAVLEKLFFQGLYSSEIEDSLKLSWEWLLKLKNLVLPMAFQATGNEGVRLLAVKFAEAIILLYTPDPNISSDPPLELSNDMRFNISWLRGGHPLLNVGDLAIEATQNLGLLLDQLKFPQVKSLSSSMIIVFINSLSAIAQRRPSFYGRILPVLLCLDPSSSLLMKEVQIPGAFHALKNAFSECLKCTHSSAEPWRARIMQALKAIDSGEAAEDGKILSGGIPSSNETKELSPFKMEGSSKRSISEEITDVSSENNTPSSKRARQDTVKETDKVVSDLIWGTIKNSEAVYQLVSMFATVAAQGERAAKSLEVLSSSISSELLAEVVLVNMHNIPPAQPGGDKENSAPASDLLGTFAELASLFEEPHRVELATEVETASTPAQSDTGVDSVPNPVTTITTSVAPQIKSEPEIIESEIPGLDSTATQGTVKIKEESPEPSFTSNADASSTGIAVSHPPEEQSIAVAASSVQCVLPKMIVTNIEISDEDKDHLQREAFVRIVESDEQLLVAGGTHARLSLLAHIGVEFPLDLNPWEVLQKYILSDYVDHKGHELTVRVLYRLFRESEQDQDFLISRTATSIYESFLVTVAEALRDTFPASDKSLSKLLGEVPYLPDGAFKVLEGLCSPLVEGSNVEKHDKETPGGDRITQGLSCVWSLILLRPANRDRCLQIALESAVHSLEEVRTRAIRLVANKLYPMATISNKIEKFATEKLRSIVGSAPTTHGLNADSQQDPVLGITETQQCMSLYFALCTKKHNLLREIFLIFGDIPHHAKQVVHRHIPILIRSIGTSSDLLGILSDPPSGSEELVMKVLETLTDGLIPSRDLILAIKKLYAKIKDVELLIPVLAYLPKEEILPLFPNLVNLPMDKLQLALSRMLPAVPQSASSLSPSEVLIAIHGIDPEKDGVPLKKVMEACSACFELKTIFTQQVFAKALNQLVEQIPLPLLFMRTVIQAIGVFPGLVDFIMEIMLRLVNKQIWKYPKLWVGFVKCAIQTKPQSFGVLLQLPAPQLENALSKNPILKAPLIEHASQPHIRSTLPRSTLVVLGLMQDAPPAVPTQSASQSQAAETSKSTGDVPTETAATEVTEDSAP
ncbi:HEAT repeat-containing protein [Rhynchospora pubera]|uniref:HEAT repeat-containing protein n=1 Tax=Rhynchospora pubera TaxID=906938 RepID=A0AAV8FNA8_9POAL|nr:HEAT repeat-containing protein [Rhynchospora pubera]